MALSNRFQCPRGTRAALNSLAGASGLKVGEIYLITDENRLAVGLTTSTYEVFAKVSEAGGSGSPGGTSGQIQFNNAGAFGGASNVNIDSQGDLLLDYSATPATPGADQLSLVGNSIAISGGRVWPRIHGEDGIFTSLQAHLGRNSVVWAQAVGGVTTAIAPVGGVALTASGTATARTFATTNRLTRAKRIGYVSSAVAGNTAGLTNTVSTGSFYTLGGAAGGGFLAIFRFAVSDASLVSGAHAMIGLRGANNILTTTNPNTIINSISVAQTNGSTNWMICYGGSAAQTPINTGMAINNTDFLEFTLYARPDVNNSVAWRLENISTGVVANGVLTGTSGTALPATATGLGPIIWRSNNATAAAVGIDIAGYYMESDI